MVTLTQIAGFAGPGLAGAGYVPQGTWWRVGFTVSLVNLAIWLGVGMIWWKLLGWWLRKLFAAVADLRLLSRGCREAGGADEAGRIPRSGYRGSC